jgi:Phosphorylated CTD interacting factor 1 WW domain
MSDTSDTSNILSSSSSDINNKVYITQIENEFINFLVHKKLIKLGEKHFKELNFKIKIDNFFYNEWFVAVQCVYWARLEEMDNHPDFFIGLSYNGYNPVSKWEFQNVLRANIMKCMAKIIDHFETELLEKTEYGNIKELKNKYKLEKLIEKFADIINNKHQLIDKINETDNKIFYLKNKHIIYKNYEFKIDDRMQFLIDNHSIQKVLRMLLRYSGLGIDAMQCSLPYELYQYFYHKYNVRGEGFSSPLNSKLIEFNNTKICTAFKDTDHHFGSLGRFSKEKLINNSDFNWTVNPPYVQSIIRHSFNEIISAINTIERDDFLVIYLIPKAPEDDDFYYETIKPHKYIQKYIEPAVGDHYMNCNGTLVHMKGTVNAMFFISKSKKYKNIDEEKLMSIWNDPNNDPTKGQSNFTKLVNVDVNKLDLSNYETELDNTDKIPIATDLPKSIRQYIDEKAKKYSFEKQKGGKKTIYKRKYYKYELKYDKLMFSKINKYRS